MRHRRAALLGLLLALGWGRAAGAAPVAEADPAVRRTAKPILENILAALAAADREAYVRDFGPALRGLVDEEHFARTVADLEARLGAHVSHRYLGFLNQRGMTVVLYKAAYDGTDDDVLIKLVLTRTAEDEVLVTGLWFQ
jgi:hypothetical protein